MMQGNERRRSVRMRPIAELPATARLLVEGQEAADVRIVDVSVGGLAASPVAGRDAPAVGAPMHLRLSLARYGVHDVVAVVRWASDELLGTQFVDLSPAATTAVRRYVAELLERGAPS